MKNTRLATIPCAILLVLLLGAIGSAAHAGTVADASSEVRELLDAGRIAEAESASQALVADAERRYGPDSAQTATALHLRIRALNGLGRPMVPETRKLADRVVAMLDGKVPSTDPRLKDAADVVWFTTALEADEFAFRKAVRELGLYPVSPCADVVTVGEQNLAQAEVRFGRETAPVATAMFRVLRARNCVGWVGRDVKQLAESVLAIYEKRIPPDDPRLGLALSELARVETSLGEFAAAEAHYQRALPILEAALGQDAPEVSRTLYDMAYLMLRQVRPEGRDYLERKEAIDLRRRERAVTPEETVNAMEDLAKGRRRLGAFLCGRKDDHARGRELLLRTANELESELGVDDALTLDVRTQFAMCANGVVEQEEGNEVLKGVLRSRERVFGPDNELVAQLLNILGMSEAALGDLPEARSYFEKSMAAYETVNGPESFGVVLQLNNIGSLRLGRAKGVPELLRAQAMLEKQPASRNLEWQIPNNLGVAYLELGEHAAAKAAFERSIAAAEKIEGPKAKLSAGTRVHFARLLTRTGDFVAAELQLEKALPVFEEFYGSDSYQVAYTLGELAVAQAMAGDGVEARRLAERSATIAEAALTPEQPELTYLFRGLAEVRLAAGDRQGALEAALKAAALESHYARLIGSKLAEGEALAYVSKGSPALDLTLSLTAAWAPDERKRTAWDLVVRSRSLVLDEMGLRNRLISGLDDPEARALAGRLGKATERLARAAVRTQGGQMSGHDRDWLTHERAEKEAAERRLAELSWSFRETLRQQSLGLAEVNAALPPKSALVSYVLYENGRRTRVDVGHHPGTPSYLAFVMGSGATTPVIVPLGPAASIDTLVAAVRENVALEATAPGRSPKRGEAAYRDVASRLREKIWDPLIAPLAGARSVFIVPDGSLNLVDWAALPAGANGYLVETGPAIAYLSAERDLVRIGDATPGAGLLVMGAPDFNEPGLATEPNALGGDDPGIGSSSSPTPPTFRGARSVCGDFRSLRFELLPGSAAESRAVASQWQKAATKSRNASAAGLQNSVKRLEGTSASEALFKKEAPGKRVLHLATHGFFLGDRCGSAAPQDASLPAEVEENPLLLSGLGFAGANLRESASPDVEDGILTAEEIAALDLSGVEWVVLSACDTGLGAVRAGEGVFGFRRAFRLAGAQSVVLSLWPVEDRTALEWMTGLYHQRLTHGRSLSDAARLASTDLLRKRRSEGAGTHPFYWAGFVASGSGR